MSQKHGRHSRRLKFRGFDEAFRAVKMVFSVGEKLTVDALRHRCPREFGHRPENKVKAFIQMAERSSGGQSPESRVDGFDVLLGGLQDLFAPREQPAREEVSSPVVSVPLVPEPAEFSGEPTAAESAPAVRVPHRGGVYGCIYCCSRDHLPRNCPLTLERAVRHTGRAFFDPTPGDRLLQELSDSHGLIRPGSW